MVVRLLSKCTEYIDLLKFNNMVLIAYHMFGKSIQRHRVDHVEQPLINHEPFVIVITVLLKQAKSNAL